MEYPKLPATSSYEPWIRVFILQPATDIHAPLIGRLENHKIAGRIIDKRKFRSQVLTSNYDALSYVWGSPVGSRTITVNQQRLLVTNNCEEALRHLRLPTKERRLWVDAITIDQGNSTEKEAQVKLMGDIYRAAKQTVVWLGPALPGTAEFFSKASISRSLLKMGKFVSLAKIGPYAITKQGGLGELILCV